LQQVVRERLNATGIAKEPALRNGAAVALLPPRDCRCGGRAVPPLIFVSVRGLIFEM
jgi:hypothetical protein